MFLLNFYKYTKKNKQRCWFIESNRLMSNTLWFPFIYIEGEETFFYILNTHNFGFKHGKFEIGLFRPLYILAKDNWGQSYFIFYVKFFLIIRTRTGNSTARSNRYNRGFWNLNNKKNIYFHSFIGKSFICWLTCHWKSIFDREKKNCFVYNLLFIKHNFLYQKKSVWINWCVKRIFTFHS